MTCIVEPAASQMTVDNRRFSHARPSLEFSHKNVPLNCNTFTVCHSSIHPDAIAAREFLDNYAPRERPDMPYQRSAMQRHRMLKLREIIERHERECVMGEEDRVIALKCLAHTAAKRGLQDAMKRNYPPNIICHVRRTWQILLKQAYLYFSWNFTVSSEDDVTAPKCRWRTALEIISSLGLWSEREMAIPFRRYVLRFSSTHPSLKDVLTIGIVSFSYSSYVIDSCHNTQVATLSELCRISKQHGVNVKFLSLMALPESPLRDSWIYHLHDGCHGESIVL